MTVLRDTVDNLHSGASSGVFFGMLKNLKNQSSETAAIDAV